MPAGPIALPNRPFRFGKKLNLSVLCVLSVAPLAGQAPATGQAGGKEFCASFFLDKLPVLNGNAPLIWSQVDHGASTSRKELFFREGLQGPFQDDERFLENESCLGCQLLGKNPGLLARESSIEVFVCCHSVFRSFHCRFRDPMVCCPEPGPHCNSWPVFSPYLSFLFISLVCGKSAHAFSGYFYRMSEVPPQIRSPPLSLSPMQSRPHASYSKQLWHSGAGL